MIIVIYYPLSRVNDILRRTLLFYVRAKMDQNIGLSPVIALSQEKFTIREITARIKFDSNISKKISRNRKFKVNES